MRPCGVCGWPALIWWRETMSTRARQVARIVAVLACLIVSYYAVTLAQTVRAGRVDDVVPEVRVAVVLGAAQYDGRPSAQFASRLDHAAALVNDGRVDSVVVTGGGRPGDRFTEAEAGQRYLVAAGLDLDQIRVVPEGSTTWESLDAVHTALAPDGIEGIIVVTDRYHVLRSELIARAVGFGVVGASPVDDGVLSAGTSMRRHIKEAAGVAVGRIVGFESLSGRG